MFDKEKRYSISEVSKITGYEPHVLRYYENDFNLEIPRTKSNRRYYTYKEIEQIIYIKELQQKGLTNKQIKLILESPELVLPASSEVAATSSEELSIVEDHSSDIVQVVCSNMNESINNNISFKLEEMKEEIIDSIDSMLKEKDEIEHADSIRKEKDVLICENARLKMKVKEKSYELAQLKEKMSRLDQQKIPFWKKIFSK
ncbi:MerR family transcriptional regulator [Crassaminicella profunda]|uniref:MerR family transcriptional regulator n=1 Tax=Crassaminicella profunda TaxID=1286698 RepID=UPI001CA73D3F|nr:MerR family transcriptional regulator [Crassaminicella profunda]QZY56892.1 MerR family transcriptional regulator [Crassaminicella profunda]